MLKSTIRSASGPVKEDECAEGVALLVADGKFEYPALPNDAADEDWMVKNTPALTRLFQQIPNGNGKYSMFVRTIVGMMSTGAYGVGSIVLPLAIHLLMVAIAQLDFQSHLNQHLENIRMFTARMNASPEMV